jgi:hypothetical protein
VNPLTVGAGNRDFVMAITLADACEVLRALKNVFQNDDYATHTSKEHALVGIFLACAQETGRHKNFSAVAQIYDTTALRPVSSCISRRHVSARHGAHKREFCSL